MKRDRKGISISIEEIRGLLPDPEEEMILNVPYTADGRHSVLAMLARMEGNMVLLEICDDKAGDGLPVRSMEIAGKRYSIFSSRGTGLGEGCNIQERMMLAYMLARGVKLGRLEREPLCDLRINCYEIQEDQSVACGGLEMPQIVEGCGTDIGLELQQQYIPVTVDKDISLPVGEYDDPLQVVIGEEEEISVYISGVRFFDPWADAETRFLDKRYTERFSEEEIQRVKKEYLENLPATCPKGCVMPVVEYECEGDHQLQFSCEDLQHNKYRKAEEGASAVFLLFRPDKKTGPMGMRNRACVLGAVEEGFKGKLNAKICSYYRVIPKRNLWLRLPGRGWSFRQILREHMEKHPLMEPQDYGKLCFQSEFGPEHLIEDGEQAITYLREEWKSISSPVEPQFPESIGNGLCRFPLAACSAETELELLGKLFILTARECHGTMEGLLERLEQAEEMIRVREPKQAEEPVQKETEEQTGEMHQISGCEISGIQEWIEDWKRKGCLPVHHSQVYRDNYDPHYRLIKKDYAGYFPALLRVREIVMKGQPAVIAVDGRCGSGKTHFAGLIEKLFPCNVFHMDDFYLPMEMRQENWMEIPGGNMDFVRFQTEILNSVRSGEELVYCPYSCRKGSLGEEIRVPFQALTVVEGSYSHHPALEAGYDLRIFLTCSEEEQRRRLQEREKDYFKVFEERWLPLEENYFRCYNVEENSHLTVDTSGFFE